ncbi:Spo0B domain-containing protein [Cohnella sp. GCM10027633]|uniref:Spo0B domain-containing protein n=1 Tax=unclassified Cohnella TaxID=2636738 RepID=UPI00363398B9
MKVRKLTPWEIFAASSLALPIAAIFVWPDPWWPLALFVIWSVALGGILMYAASRRDRERYERLLDHAHASVIQTLSHHRHDWMNELQVLYGYLRLNKPDKAVAIVDRIRARMDHDSRLSHFGIPKLSIYLLSFRTMCDTMRLDVEVQEGLQLDRAPYDTDKLALAIIGMINVIRVRTGAASSYDNVLKLSLSQSESGLQVDLAYTGELAAADSVNADLTQCLDGIGHVALEQLSEEKPQARTLVVRFPLPA